MILMWQVVEVLFVDKEHDIFLLIYKYFKFTEKTGGKYMENMQLIELHSMYLLKGRHMCQLNYEHGSHSKFIQVRTKNMVGLITTSI